MSSNDKLPAVDDFKAGLIVSLVALPLCLGIALASGAPLISGLFAGIVGGIIVGTLSDSHVSVSGPAAGLAIIVLGAIQDFGSFNIFLASVVVAGAIQILFGLFKLGAFAKKIHSSVIEGMLASIGVLIIIKQLPYAFGVVNFEGYRSIEWTLNDFNIGALLIGTCCLTALIIYNTTKLGTFFVFKWVPFSIWLVTLASAAAHLMGNSRFALNPNQFVNIGTFGRDGGVWNAFQHPDFSQLLSFKMLKYSIVIAIVASIETLLCIEAGDKLSSQKRPTSVNRELKAQGIGNIVSGLIGGLPITSVILRTSVNIYSGAKSKISTIVHGTILLLSLLLFPQLLSKIPLTILACILLNAGYNLTHPRLLRKMAQKTVDFAIPFFATIALVVSFDLLTGVILGQILAILVSWTRKFKTKDLHA